MVVTPSTVVAATIKIVPQESAPTVKMLAMMPTVVPVHHGEKPEKFNGLNFKK